MNFPTWVGVATVVLFLGVNGLALAAHLFWKRHRPIFWVASTFIVVGVGYLVATGAAEDVARLLWPIPFDPERTREFETRLANDDHRSLGAMLITFPFVIMLAWVSWRRSSVPLLPMVLLIVFTIYLHASPISGWFVRLVVPDHMLKQTKARQINPR